LTVVPPPLVDALPERLWSLGNLYQFFGQSLHFCVGGDGTASLRTIEVNGHEVGQGRKPFRDFVQPLDGEAGSRRWRFDLGWLVVGGIAAYIAVALTLGRVLRRAGSRGVRER
jgi:hypothetical protein